MGLTLMRLSSLVMGQGSLECGNLKKVIVQVTYYITQWTQSRPVIMRYGYKNEMNSEPWASVPDKILWIPFQHYFFFKQKSTNLIQTITQIMFVTDC